MIPALQPVPREEIDNWPVAEAGLPPRIVHAAVKHGLTAVGRLRDLHTGMIPGIGLQSEKHLLRFLQLCDKLSSGETMFDDLMGILSFFLDSDQVEVLTYRYGLHVAAVPDTRQTLQSIGTTRHVSRERVRQVESSALSALRTRLAQKCLEPVYKLYCRFIDAEGGASEPQDLDRIPDKALLNGMNPAGLLRMLTACRDVPVFCNGFFSTVSVALLRRIDATIMELLSSTAMMTADEVFESSRTNLQGITQKTVLLHLEHHPDLLRLNDGRYGCFDIPGPAVMQLTRESMRRLPSPVHFKAVLAAVNTLLKPGSRLGTGHMLEMLASDPAIERGASGFYTLRDQAE